MNQKFFNRQLIIDTEKYNIDVPTRIYSNRDQYWIKDGLYHRDNDLPAIIRSNGIIEWWINGERHRVNAPALITINGNKVFYHHGKKHRIGGPAIILSDGSFRWYLNDLQLNSFEINEWIQENNIEIPFSYEVQTYFNLKFFGEHL